MPIRDLTRKFRKTLSKKNRTHKRKQLGAGCGCDSRQSGGRIIKPSEFYGGNSKRYHTVVPGPEDHAYGKTNAVSFGSLSDDMKTSGPNLGPYPNSSGMMTGGNRSRYGRKNGKRSTKSSKKYRNMKKRRTRNSRKTRSKRSSRK